MHDGYWRFAVAYISLAVSLFALLLFLHICYYRIATRSYRLSDPETPDDHVSFSTASSSSSVYSESRDIE
jgi:hypothetical protein